MKRTFAIALIVVVALAAITLSGTVNAQIPEVDDPGHTAVGVLAEYFDMLISGNLESARHLWSQPVLDRANRFDITFQGIPVKVDCNSPVVRNLDVMRDHIYPTARTFVHLPGGNYTRLEYRPIVNGRPIYHDYFAYYDGSYYWLTHPQEYYTRGWPVIESEYVRIHYHPSRRKYINDLLLEELDQFVKTTSKRLGMSDKQFEKIELHKIEYFYCDDDSTVQNISGHLAKGLLDLPTNDIISAYMPHYHEMVHLLVNITLQDISLFTQPLLREGVAVYYGGRWGKAPDALFGLGSFLYNQKIVELDSLLTMRSFEAQATSDIAYPVAGLFVGFLEQRLGREKLFDLYRTLSGNFDTLYAQSAGDVQSAVIAASGHDTWDLFLDDFEGWMDVSIVDEPAAAPGARAASKPVVQDDRYRVVSSKDWVVFEFNTDGSEDPQGNLIFGVDERLKGNHSSLFEEQYDQNLLYEGHRWGVRYDGNEVGLYDYGTNQLVAKYIWGLTPSDEYWNKENNTITVSIRRSLLPEEALKDTRFKILPH